MGRATSTAFVKSCIGLREIVCIYSLRMMIFCSDLIMDKIKILYFHHAGGKGGAPQSLLYLLQTLDRSIYEPTIACAFNQPHAKQFFEEHGFPPIHIPAAPFVHVWPSGWWPVYNPRALIRILMWTFVRFPRSALALAKALDEVKPDLVHLNSLVLAPLVWVVRRKRIPVVLHVRETAIRGSFGLRWRGLRWLAGRCADWTIYICKDNQDQLTGPTQQSSVIYNPVPFKKFDRTLSGEDVRAELKIPPDAKVLFFPGGSSDLSKGIEPFLDALAKIRKNRNDVVALIPKVEQLRSKGSHLYQNRIQKQMNRLQLEDAIVWVPFTDTVQRYFAAADVVVAPFVVPHFSRAVMEAGAMAKPVVGSRIGGVEEVIVDDVTGRLTVPGDAEDLALQLSFILENPERACQMGEAGFEQACSQFRASVHGVAVADVYQRVFAKYRVMA